MRVFFGSILAAVAALCACPEAAAQATAPALQGAVSRMVHGSAGTFDLSLSLDTANPTTEPRRSPSQSIVLTFDKPIDAATVVILAGAATAAVPTISGNNVTVGLSGVSDQQYLTIALSNVVAADGGVRDSAAVRIGFLAGDVNQSRVVSVADLGLVNAQLTQPVSAANFLKDVNASGTVTLADKGITNANLTRALPAPPADQPPQVNAGVDQTVTLPASANLAGSVTDDGLPNPPGTVTTGWSKFSGPGTVTFSNASAAVTTASFSVDGVYVLRLTGNDGATSATDDVQVTVNASGPSNQPPFVSAGVDQAVTLPASAELSGTVIDDGLPSVPGVVTVAWSKLSGPGTVAFGNGSAVMTSASFSVAGLYVLRLTASDGMVSAFADVTITVAPAGTTLPPDPISVAPALDGGTSTDPVSSTTFLYTGVNPIQTGVAPGTIEFKRAAVLRGRVLDRSGAALTGVTISILAHPEFGQTLSRADGRFDLVVNGGGLLTVDYAKAGFLRVQRQANAPTQDYHVLDDAVMIPVDPAVTTITSNAAVMQVAQGSVQSDASGTRRATVLFPAGTTAALVQPDGSTVPAGTLHLRFTEYTVGTNGPQAMPGPLPAASAYTYAVELGADEAVARVAGREVIFNQPVFHYIENFLGFPVGVNVPVGFYDRDRAQWIPSDNGRVIKIISVTGGLADIDSVGTGGLPPLVLSAAERQQLGLLYAIGQELWRVPVQHFSTYDHNWGAQPPVDAVKPNQPPPTQDTTEDKCIDIAAGSIIECQNQILGEAIPVAGTSFTLNYRSLRTPGRTAANTIRIPLSGNALPASLAGIELQLTVAGRTFKGRFPAVTNQTYTFTWDGLDAYGRAAQGAQSVSATIAYAYPGVYADTGAFARFGTIQFPTNSRNEVILTQSVHAQVGGFDARSIGLGGWILSPHHVYDVGGQELHLGNGQRRRADTIGPVIGSIKLKNPDDTPSSISNLSKVEVGPDGTVFAHTSTGLGLGKILKITPDGKVYPFGSITDITQYGLALAPDGSLYVAQEAADDVGLDGGKITRIAPDGTMTIIAGTGVAGYSGDGGPAALAQLNRPIDVAVAPDGTVYIADEDNFRIRAIGTDGIITTVAGDGTQGYTGDGGPAAQARIGAPLNIAAGPDGSVYFSDYDAHRIRRIGPDGIITTVAGIGLPCLLASDDCGDGGPAAFARIASQLGGLTVGRDGSIYLPETDTRVVRKIGPDGIIRRLAGMGKNLNTFVDGLPALQVNFNLSGPNNFFDVAIAADGAAYVVDISSQPLKRVTSPFPSLSNVDILVASEDSGELYVFDAAGRHLRTLDALTNATLFEFTYDAMGRLASVSEKTGGTDNVTTIQHDASGNPVKIVGPFGQQTLLAVDANGFLASITNPAGETTQLASTASGLLRTFTDPRGNLSQYVYDAQGRLVQSTDAAGGIQTIVRTELPDGFSVAKTTALGRTTHYKVEQLGTGSRKLTTTLPSGESSTILSRQDGTNVVTQPDGTVITTTLGPDPRFGMQAPFAALLTNVTPGGLVQTRQTTKTAALSDPNDLSSLASLTRNSTVNGQATTQSYTAATRTTVTTSPQGRTLTTTTDPQGRIVASQRSGLAPITIAHDSRGRIATIAVGSGVDLRTTQLAYGADGNLASVVDPAGRTTQYTRDSAGRVTHKTMPDGGVVDYAYDMSGNLASLKPPGQPATAFQHSVRDELTRETPPVVSPGGPMDFVYDPDRALSDVLRPDDRSVSISYDLAGKPVARKLKAGEVVVDTDFVTHDPSGRIASIAAASGASSAFAYDGSLVTGETLSGVVAGSLTKTFDALHRVTTRSLNGGNTIAYSYDADDLMTLAGGLAITRDPQSGLATAGTIGTVTTTFTHSGFGEPMQFAASAGVTPLYSYAVTRDALGRVILKSETIGGSTDTFAYAYDLAGRLVSVTKNGGAFENYTYDANGNRIAATVQGTAAAATYDAQDRLVQYGGTTYQFTAAGELQQRALGGQITTLQYDPKGNLRTAALPDGTVISYVIDGNDRRIGKKVDGVLTQAFLYHDSLRPEAELDGAGSVVSRFVFTRGSSPAYMTKGGVNFRFVTDQTGSVRLVVNAATGAIAQRLDYDAFGNVLLDTNPGFQPFGYAGGLYDRNTGLVRFGARDYDAKVGRWTAKDPAGFFGRDTNLYAYAHNDPLNRIDPAGNADVSVAVPEQSIDANAVIADIIQILAADPEFVDRTDSVFKHGPKPGDVRNGLLLACFVASGMFACDPVDPFAAYYVCSGIADYADRVLKDAIAEGRLPGVVSAESKGRHGVLGTDHQALFVTLNDGTTMVLDWHATLDPQHPLVSTPEQWCMGDCM